MKQNFFFAALMAVFVLVGCGDDDVVGRDVGGDDANPADTNPPDTNNPDTNVDCLSGLTECNMACVNLQTSNDHCGTCNSSCAPNESCVAGSCMAELTCTSPEMDCGGSCTDVRSDSNNCGRCGIQCGEGESCTRGSCEPPVCGMDLPDRCEDICTDFNVDNRNCGRCGNACAGDARCVNGSCEATCPNSLCEVDGNQECIDTNTDAAHCGGCGNVCDAGEVCNGGTCGCPSGQVECGGRCVDTDSDAAHCGSCNNACPMGSTCSMGMCECPSGTTACGTECVNTQISTDNCGGCGNVCASTQSCAMGMCEGSTCRPGQIECGGTCTNPNTDTANCGACGNACGTGQTCDVGVCRPLNDLRANAVELTLPSTGAELEIVGSTTGATTDVPSVTCNAAGPNVWYEIELTERGVLWVDTAASDYDTAIFVTDSTGTPVSDMCNDDCGCRGRGDFEPLESCVGKMLSAGTYYISVGGFGPSSSGDFLLHVQFLPDAIGAFTYTSRLEGTGVTRETNVLSASSASAQMCGSLAAQRTMNSGEDVRWFAACGDTRNVLLSVCQEDGGSWEGEDSSMVRNDPVLYAFSAQTGAEIACNDDGGSAFSCQPDGGGPNFGSRLVGLNVPRGIGAVFVDNRNDGRLMSYRLAYDTDDIL